MHTVHSHRVRSAVGGLARDGLMRMNRHHRRSAGEERECNGSEQDEFSHGHIPS